MLGVYLGAIPASAAFFASLSEFDLWGLLAAALRWRRSPGRYVPGGGETAPGYVLLADGTGRHGRRGAPDARPRVAVGLTHGRSCEPVMARRARPRGELAEAGELAAVEAIDRGGVVITSDGRVRAGPAGDAAEPADPRRRGPPRRSPAGFAT